MLKLVKTPRPDAIRMQARRWLSGAAAVPEMPECKFRVENLATLYRLAASPSSAPEAFKLLQEMVLSEVETALQRRAIDRTVLELASVVNRVDDLYNSAPSAYFNLDAGHRILTANRAAIACFARGQSSLDGRRIEDLFNPESGAMFGRWLDEVNGRAFNETCELHLERAGVGARHFCVMAKLLDAPGEILVMMIDVTPTDGDGSAATRQAS